MNKEPLSYNFIRFDRWRVYFRVFGRGLGFELNAPPPLFSERNGYIKAWRFMGCRLHILPRLR